MNKCLRQTLIASLLLSMTAVLPSAARARQDDAGQNAPGAGRGHGGRGGHGRGNGQGGPPSAGDPSATTPAPAAKNGKLVVVAHTAGEKFYIISSVDPAKQEILLKQPQEVTLLMKVGDSTQYLDETGKPIKLSDLRAGDTAWVASSGGGTEPTAVRVRKGQMTVADLHRFYLDYPEIK
jgi:hypothetical protein